MIALRTAFLVAAFVVTALMLLPLRFAWAATTTPREIEVASITGTVWSGQLRDVRWRGFKFGDLQVSSSVIERPGDLIMHLRSRTGPLTSARLAASSDGVAVEGLAGAIELSRLFPQAPSGAMLQLTDGALNIEGSSCRGAKGRVTTDEIKTQRLPGLEGTVTCEKGGLIVSLASLDGSHNLKLAVDIGAAMPAALIVDADPATMAWLAAMEIPVAANRNSK